MKMGGIPEYILTDDISYVDNLIDNIIYKHIVAYYGVRDLAGIKDLFRLLVERAGKQISINKIAKIIGISQVTSLALSLRQVSKPSIPGIMTSNKMRSGLFIWVLSKAISPLIAVKIL